MTPHETLRTMTPTMQGTLREFVAHPKWVGDGRLADLALRGIVRLDRQGEWVLSAHGRRVWELVKLGA